MNSFLFGMATSAGLILAIGAQNAFVLRQGVRREHVLAVVALCVVSDSAMIALGTAGIGLVSVQWPWMVPALTLLGGLFLLVYGLQAARRATRSGAGLDMNGGPPLSLASALLQAAAFTWLNPHAWLDTTVLIGSLANTQGPDGKWVFAAGAMCSSVLWFAGLAWTAGRLAPLFRRPGTWRIFDAGVAAMMLTLAVGLTRQAMGPG